MRTHLPLYLAAAVALTGCASAPPPAPAASVAIAPEVHLVLPAPGELGRSIDAVQQVTARRASQVYVFEVRLQAAPQHVRLAGTDAAGRRAMTIDWRPDKLAVERAAWLPDVIRPEHVLTDLVLAFWPEAPLRKVLSDSGATLTIDPMHRTIRREGRDLVLVQYDNPADPWSGLTRLRNLAWNYELEIRSQRVTP
jgi:hypothetical protein